MGREGRREVGRVTEAARERERKSLREKWLGEGRGR